MSHRDTAASAGHGRDRVAVAMKDHHPPFPLLPLHALLLLLLLFSSASWALNWMGDPGEPGPAGDPARQLGPCPAPCNCSLARYPPALPRSLLTVDCSGQELSSFPPDLPNATQVLVMANNRMLNLSSLPALLRLQRLDLSYNRIAFLDNHWVFEHLELLTQLSLRGNNLKILKHGSFSGLRSLDELDLTDNSIKTVEVHAFGGLNHLNVLRLGHNDLFELQRKWLLSMTSLRELYVEGNHISVIEENTFDKINSLLHVDLSDNALWKVSTNGFLGLEQVKVLNLSDNAFVDVPTEELRRLSSLDILLLDGNKMTALNDGDLSDINVSSISLSFMLQLSTVHRGAFTNLTKLRTLQLHDNPKLIFINPHAFSNVPLLHRLLLHNNKLVTLSESVRNSVPALDELHLYHNYLHCDCNIFWLKRDMVLDSGFLNGSNHSYIVDGEKLQCNQPEDHKNVFLQQVPLENMRPVCPPTTLPFFSDTVNVSIGDDLQLECQAIGVPEPDLVWTLADGRVVNGSSEVVDDEGQRLISVDNTLLTISGLQMSDQGTYTCRAQNSFGQDTNSVTVSVYNKDLRLSITHTANDYVTVEWAGSIPRHQMSHFQINYRKSSDSGREGAVIDTVYLHGNMHSCTLSGLTPMTSYEICLVYRGTYSVQCRNFTTDHKVALVEPAIMRIDMTRIVASVCATLGVLFVLCLVRVVARRLRRRKEYEDPLREGGETDKIPLESMERAPGTPLCSSRTALLPHSQI